jgi:dopamine beta-monooxygenase
MPEECRAFLFGWAPGTPRVDAPPEAGHPLGRDSVRYLALQVHFDNPQGLAGVLDNSGFRVSITRKLRPYDMGILTLGSQSFTVPPGQAYYTIAPNACPAKCTSRFAGPLTVSANGFHMHMTGRAAVTRLFRDGKELQPIGFRRHFDFECVVRERPPPLSAARCSPLAAARRRSLPLAACF